MLTSELIKKIEDFVYIKPRSIQEISIKFGKNWRTVDRYVSSIIEERATLDSRIFREGTRGALKIVYWASVEKRKDTVFQERLTKEILHLGKKEDFSAFDLYQHVREGNKEVSVEDQDNESMTNLGELVDLMRQTKKELISFSGNLSYINLKKGDINLFKELESLVKRGIRIKVLCRVDLTGKENVEKLLSLNNKYKKELVEIRHSVQPVRALIFDKRIMRLKEINLPTGKIHESNKKVFIFYTIRDKEWAEWLMKIFLQLFHGSIGAEGRLQELDKLF